MTTYKIIVNPTSGRGAGGLLAPKIKTELEKYKLDFDLVQTSHVWHAADLARQAVKDGFDVVVSAGGDGTANEVINGIMLARETGQGKVKMGVISVGRGNDFAYSMGLPTEWEACCKTLAEGRSRFIDIGKVTGGLYPEGRYFGNGVGIGFDAVVGFEAVKLTRLHGFPSYIVAALRTIFLYFDAPTLKIEMDHQTITQPSLMVSIMNGIRMGGGFMMAPGSLADDEKFDLCIAHQVSRPQVFGLIPLFMKGTQAKHFAIKTARSSKVVVTALFGTIPAHADGETLCTKGDKLVIEIVPQQLELIHPGL